MSRIAAKTYWGAERIWERATEKFMFSRRRMGRKKERA
jgi:hypothetical protein